VNTRFFALIPNLFRNTETLNAILITNVEIMSNVSYYTEEGLKKLRDELRQLKDIERPKVSQAIADARDKGDLSENAEYDAAKEAQGMLEMKIAKLEETLAGARLIDESQLDTSKILVLSIVKIKNQTNGMEMTYTLVADGEADLASGKISVNSPIGKGLLGKSVGDVAEIQVPNGVMKFDILEISR
jgi:transcription elongation factor GreA